MEKRLKYIDVTPGRVPENRASGRIGSELTKSLVLPKTPALYDPEGIEAVAVDIISKKDRAYEERFKERTGKVATIERKNKPVYFNHTERMIVAYLEIKASQAYDSDPELRKKIDDPDTKQGIGLSIDIHDITRKLFGKYLPKYAVKVIEGMIRMSSMWQWEVTSEEGGRRKHRITPYINIENVEFYEDLSEAYGRGEKEISGIVDVILGHVFFKNLANRYAPIDPPRLFEIWRKNGRQGELFDTLLFELLSVWFAKVSAADKCEADIRNSRKYSTKEKEARIPRAREKALSHVLLFSTIKEKVGTDYDSSREQRKRFEADLIRASDILRDELKIISSYKIIPGRDGEKKVIFVMNEHYSPQRGEDLTEEESRLLE